MTRSSTLSLCLLVVLCLINLYTYVSAQTPFTLSIVYSSDVRGRMLPVTSTTSSCTSKQLNVTTCFGGVARRSQFIKDTKARLNNTNVVALDIGNYFFGSLFYQLKTQPPPVPTWFGQQYDIMGLGSNDFFTGVDDLSNYIAALPVNVPTLGSNLIVSDPVLNKTRADGSPFISEYVVKNFNGREVAFIHVVSEALSTLTSTTTVKIKPNTTDVTIRATVAKIKITNPSCNIFIVSSTVENTQNFAANIGDIVPVVFAEYGITPNTTINVVNSGKPGSKSTVIISPISAYGENIFGGAMGFANLTFDDNGNLLSYYNSWTPLNGLYPNDATLVPSVIAASNQVDALSSVVAGKTTIDLYGESGLLTVPQGQGCRYIECNMGDLITDAILDWCPNCDLAHHNAGGIRASLTLSGLGSACDATGCNITRGNVLAVLPFRNAASWYRARGSTILEMINFVQLNKTSTGGFQQWSGLRYSWNPATRQITRVQIFDKTSNKYLPIDITRVYTIGTMNFVLNGGDGLTMIPTGTISKFDLGPDVAELVYSYINKKRVITSSVIPTFNYTMTNCYNYNYTLLVNGTGTSSEVQWPNLCRIIQDDGVLSLAELCPTNRPICEAGGEMYPGKPFSTRKNACLSCSGLGTCDATTLKCVCDGPSGVGLFGKMAMLQGPSCDIVRTEYEVSPGLISFLYFLGAATIFVGASAALFFFIYRETPVIKRSAVLFLQIACFGCILAGISAIFIAAPTTDTSCQVSQWLGHFAFVFTFGALFTKTWRIYAIFGNKKLRTVRLTDTDMFKRLGLFIVLELILRIVETSVAPLKKAVDIYGETGGCGVDTSTIKSPWQYYFHCDSDSFSIFDAIAWIYKAFFTLWGVYLAVSIKGIEKNFNESKQLAIVIYHMTFLSVLVKMIIIFVLGSKNPSATVALSCIAICYIAIFTILALSVPKYMIILQHGPTAGANQTNTSKLGATQNVTGLKSAAGSDDDSNSSNQPTTPAGLKTALNKHTLRLRNATPANRAEDISEYINAAQAFIDGLVTLRSSTGSMANLHGNRLRGNTGLGSGQYPAATSPRSGPSLARTNPPTPSHANGARNDSVAASTDGIELVENPRPSPTSSSSNTATTTTAAAGTATTPSASSSSAVDVVSKFNFGSPATKPTITTTPIEEEASIQTLPGANSEDKTEE